MGNYLSWPAGPWRQLETQGSWTKKYRDELVDDIRNEEMPRNVVPRIFIWGATQAGKSSLMNSFSTVEKGRIANKVVANRSKNSVTNRLRECHLHKCCFLDAMGLEKEDLEGISPEDAKFVMEGNIQAGYKFDGRNPIAPESAKYKTDPSLAEMAHCNILVVRATQIHSETMEIDLKKKLLKVMEYAHNADVATILVLTAIDEVCEKVAKDVKHVYESKAIRDVVQRAFEIFGIPKMNIFPVKNYTEEIEVMTNMDILLLLAERQSVRFAKDHIENVS